MKWTVTLILSVAFLVGHLFFNPSNYVEDVRKNKLLVEVFMADDCKQCSACYSLAREHHQPDQLISLVYNMKSFNLKDRRNTTLGQRKLDRYSMYYHRYFLGEVLDQMVIIQGVEPFSSCEKAKDFLVSGAEDLKSDVIFIRARSNQEKLWVHFTSSTTLDVPHNIYLYGYLNEYLKRGSNFNKVPNHVISLTKYDQWNGKKNILEILPRNRSRAHHYGAIIQNPETLRIYEVAIDSDDS